MKKFSLFVITCLIGFTAFAQEGQGDNFNEAKLHLANHKLNQAIPILEKLWASDSGNANLNYLLGLCYVKEDKNIPQSVHLLETASKIYTTDYESGSNRERRAPEYVYYYLTIAHSKNGQCEEALRALNKFYQVYSYNDEYYLVDGQKWVRECNLENNPEEELKPEEPLITQRVEEDTTPEVKPEPEPEPEPEVIAVKEPEPVKEEPVKIPEPIVVKEPVVEKAPVKPEPEIVKEPEPVLTAEQQAGREILAEVIQERKEPKMKERLIPFDDWENLRTRDVNFTTMSSQYGVQVAALIDLKPTRDFKDLKNVEVYVDENGVFRYVIGRFPYRKQAESLKEKIAELGYKDAFIVDINRPDYTKEVLGIGADNIDWHLDGNVDYRVQVGAFSSLVPSAVAMKYLEIEGIKENEQNGLTILTVGNFESYAKAVEYRDSLVPKGIDDAFVVAFNRGVKVSLKEAKEYSESNKVELKPIPEETKQRKRADF